MDHDHKSILSRVNLSGLDRDRNSFQGKQEREKRRSEFYPEVRTEKKGRKLHGRDHRAKTTSAAIGGKQKVHKKSI